MSDTMRMDVAGSLFTSMYRNVKIKGDEPAAMNLEGTGSVSTTQQLMGVDSSSMAPVWKQLKCWVNQKFMNAQLLSGGISSPSRGMIWAQGCMGACEQHYCGFVSCMS
jgi:hypothetical protein